jgi:hypothetical protein
MTEIARVVGIPDVYDVVAVVPFGYPSRPAGRGRKERKPVGDVASSETFGTAWQEGRGPR